jgi:hypothetical protein
MKYFIFTRSEARISILVLCFLVISIAFRIYVKIYRPDVTAYNNELFFEVKSIIDSLKLIEKEIDSDVLKKKITFLPFDPNYADSTELSELGLSSYIINNIMKYRNSGGEFKKPSDVRRIYGMNDSIFTALKEYIQLDNELASSPITVESRPQEKVSSRFA